jgi:hypothetical protein
MGLTEAVLAVCEASIEELTKKSYGDKVDFDSQEYYEWLVDESNKMADYIFDGIDNAINYYVALERTNPPQKGIKNV